ncbi:cobaltochelatase subunit CobN [Ravibacter arvi]|uniref:Cobaltochelatase subunit CobN n=2 Tax=Ravibacter arvi TaxID=2051041 RepID=A0ABP8LZ84_9BACT
MLRPLAAFTLLWIAKTASAEKISIIVSDSYAAVAYRVSENLEKSLPEFSDKYELKVYSQGHYQERELSHVAESKLIFVYVHQGGLVEQALPQLQEALKRGASVYALGGTPAENAYKELGIVFDRKVLQYFDQGGIENLRNMVLYGLNRRGGWPLPYRDVIGYPASGIYSFEKDTVYLSQKEYIAGYGKHKPGQPWVGFYSFRFEILNGQHRHLHEHIRKLEAAGFNVLPLFGVPLGKTLEQFAYDDQGEPLINLLVSASSLPGSSPEELRHVFEKMNIPVISTIQLDQSKAEWEGSKIGLSVFNRTLHLSRSEISGQIQPTVTGSLETATYPDGTQIKVKTAIPDRVDRLVGRVMAWDSLRRKTNAEKRIALIYYSNPPGKHAIGASYLNVLPQSIQSILERLGREGYDLGDQQPDSSRLFQQIMNYGRNIGNWAPGELQRLATQGHPVKVPVRQYKEWFGQLRPAFQQEVLAKWGPPDSSRIMTWRDDSGEPYFLLPAVWYGKILLAPQPARGWNQDIDKAYHDVTLPPHHQYIAFYLYLQKQFKANAIIHLGTHGTHEWLSGKEAGLNDDDAPEALIGDMVNLYPYIVDDVGEGIQAKRRGMAIIIDHMTPPSDTAGLNPELRELSGLINDYLAAGEKSPVLASSKLEQIWQLAREQGMLKDIGAEGKPDADRIEELEHYLQDIGQKQTPFGMHTFGKSPDSTYARSTAVAIVKRISGLSNEAYQAQVSDMMDRILKSGESELSSLVNALNGGHVRSGQGNDPLRNPASLPTGKNFFAFDPSKIPSKETYNTGSALAEELIAHYRKAHSGEFPEKVTLNLWSVETIRHEGVMESQILRLLGIKPVYDGIGRVKGVEPISRQELGRPRIDVVIIPSGLYRDMFPNVMELLDKAISLAGEADESDNFVRLNIAKLKQTLIEKGIKDEKLAERLASVRMFSVPAGAYGTGVENVVEASDTWETENQVADVYFKRMSHLYGQGFWGDKPETIDITLGKGLSVAMMKKALSGTKALVHSRSSNVYGALDNDDFYQYLGGAALAIRSIDGNTPDVLVTNLSDPSQAGQETLDKFIGREMKTRYLNPRWIREMLDEGYSGGRMISKVTEHLWGWQVTVPDAVDGNKWRQVYETYVEDKYGLDIREKFEKGGNLHAYQVTLARMLETIRKDYWNPGESVLQRLTSEYLSTVEAAGLACSGNVCNNQELTDFVTKIASRIPGQSGPPLASYRQQLADIKSPAETSSSIKNPGQKGNSSADLNPAPQKLENTQPESPSTNTIVEIMGYKMEESVRELFEDREKTENAPSSTVGIVLIIAALLAAFRVRREEL